MTFSLVVALTLLAFVGMALEELVGRLRGVRTYTLDATVSHLSCSAGNLVTWGAYGITGTPSPRSTSPCTGWSR